jgi:F-type H+-transporting ATPase subunit b
MIRLAAVLTLVAGPALAATDKPFFSLANSDFVVLIGFLIFVGILVYFKVPRKIMGLLDDRAEGIQKDLDEARALREEAQTLLASYERKTREAKGQADAIVATARREAEAAADQAKIDLQASVERRLAAADDQIESAKAAAIREVRDRAVQVAIAAAAQVVAARTSDADADRLIEQSIETVGAKLH